MVRPDGRVPARRINPCLNRGFEAVGKQITSALIAIEEAEAGYLTWIKDNVFALLLAGAFGGREFWQYRRRKNGEKEKPA